MKTNTSTTELGRNPILTVLGILILTVGLLAAGCESSEKQESKGADKSNQKTTSQTASKDMASDNAPNTSGVPKDLVDAGEFGENIYDAAKADEWKTAASRIEELRAAVATLKNQNIGAKELPLVMEKLAKSVEEKNKSLALQISNRFTFDVANLTAAYSPKVPVGITKLDFYGRELEIWAASNNTTKLKETTVALRSTWNSVKTKVEDHNGKKQAVAFENLIARAEEAKSVMDYKRIATPILDEVDNLENVFE
ncbi:MAG: hypothetical protein R2684_03530 [Pyrinomonadaceae bacterium]